MKIPIRFLAVLSVLVAGFSAPSVAQHSAMPDGMTHEEHLAEIRKRAEMNRRGAEAMGFDQEATVHHFRLYRDGGAIEVQVRRPEDLASRGAVRSHLQEIAAEFAAGTFDRPLHTHGALPDGVADMIRLKRSIVYKFEERPNGGQVRITTINGDALRAVHAFLRYQIREHGTGGTR